MRLLWIVALYVVVALLIAKVLRTIGLRHRMLTLPLDRLILGLALLWPILGELVVGLILLGFAYEVFRSRNTRYTS